MYKRQGIYNFVNDGNMDKVPQQGMTGIYELRDHMGYVDALNMLGYTLQDINNDKVPELIFAILDNEKQGKGYYGKDIYACLLYTSRIRPSRTIFGTFWQQQLLLIRP